MRLALLVLLLAAACLVSPRTCNAVAVCSANGGGACSNQLDCPGGLTCVDGQCTPGYPAR